MADIFNRITDRFGGSFAADSVALTFPALRGVVNGAQQLLGGQSGLLVQQLAATYQQQVTRLYEVGTPVVYYVGGRTSGDASLSRIIGPAVIAKAFYTTYGDICNAARNAISFELSAGCGRDGAGNPVGSVAQNGSRLNVGQVRYNMYFVVITSIGISVAAADMVVNEQLRIMFSSLTYQEDRTGAIQR